MMPSLRSAAKDGTEIIASANRYFINALYTSVFWELATPLVYVKGVGPARGSDARSQGLLTVEDLLLLPAVPV